MIFRARVSRVPSAVLAADRAVVIEAVEGGGTDEGAPWTYLSWRCSPDEAANLAAGLAEAAVEARIILRAGKGAA